MIRYVALYWFVILAQNVMPAQAQQSNTAGQYDSLTLLAKKAYSLSASNTDSGIILSAKVLQAAQANGNRLAEASAYNALAWNHYKKGNADSSIFHYKRSIKVVMEIGDPLLISRINCNVASVLISQSKYEDALKHLLIADSFAVKSKSKTAQANVKRQEAMLYREQKNNEKAIVRFKDAMQLSLSERDTLNYINAGINLGILYKDLNLYDSSLAVLNQCLEYAMKMDNAMYQINGIYEHLGGTYFGTGAYKKALEYYTKAYENHKQTKSYNDISYLAFKLGLTYSALNQFTSAEQYLLQAYQIADSLNLANYEYEMASALAVVSHKSKKWEQAYNYLNIAKNIRDSLNLITQLNQVAELQAKYESDKKEQKIALLQTEQKNTKLINVITVLAAMLAIVIAYFWINKIRLQRRLREQNLRTKIAGDLHDDVGSALSSIAMITQMVSDNLEKEKNQHVPLLRKAEASTKSIMENIDNIVWSINPNNDEFRSLELKIKEYAFPVMESKNISFTADFQKGIEGIKLNMEQRRDLYLIIKEALNNIAKYSKAKEAHLKVYQQEKKIWIAIRDNGCGFDISSPSQGAGNGLKNMQLRATQLNAKLSIKSSIGTGSEIMLSFEI